MTTRYGMAPGDSAVVPPRPRPLSREGRGEIGSSGAAPRSPRGRGAGGEGQRSVSVRWQRAFLLVVLLQTGHFAEHIIQVVQAFVLHRTAAHGLIGAGFDTEELHLVFNSALFVAMVALLAGCGFAGRLRRGVGAAPLVALFAAGTLLQGYHVSEHVVRFVNYERTGVSPQLGILGQWVNLTWLHFWLAALAFGALLAGFWACGGQHLLRWREPRA